MRTNINSFYDILELAKNSNAVLVYASSAATYGDCSSPQKIGIENPQNPYGFSKYMMDQIALRFIRKHKNISVFGLRYFNVYGPKEFYKEKTSSMVLQLGHQILNNHSPRLFKDSENIYRDFIYIDDVIQANILAAQSEHSGIYNIGTGIPRSFKDIVDTLQKVFKTNLNIDYFENPFVDYQKHTQANIESSNKLLGFKPKVSLEEGIALYEDEILKTHKVLLNA